MARKPLTLRRLNRLLWMKVYRLLGRTREANILYVRVLEGWLSGGCTRGLYDAVLATDGPGEIAEIGSWKGKSTVALALAVRQRGGTETIYAIDHHEGSTEQKGIIETEGSTWDAFRATIEAAGISDLVHPLKMDSAEAARWLTDRGVELKFAFLDGSHEEEDVLQDIRLMLPLLKPGGIMAFHDARPQGRRPGVYRAYKTVFGDQAEEIGWGGSVLLIRVPDPRAVIERDRARP